MSTVNEIRQTFLTYFRQEDHFLVHSSPLVPENDPTLLFANAGMNQFKNIFTGVEKSNYRRVVTSQKCVRAGGKHNDLENVGFTARHHTFFEMLGNFSFGDYFKEKAIFYAWDLLTNHFQLPKERLLVTYFHEDQEAKELWRKISGLSEDRLIGIKTADNFWSMGDVGPCGPCSEIFYDHGAHIAGGLPGTPDEDGDRFVEIWNLVFMQYVQGADGKRTHLPSQSIDTGMGLERLAAVLQGVHNNYDIDLFQKLMAQSQHIYGESSAENLVSHRVLADHIRSMSFLISDGVSPSNEGRGYVLRRIMRRAMRHAHQLGGRDPLLWKMVEKLTLEMGDFFPELISTKAYIEETIKLEEERFQKTLQSGLTLLEKAADKLGDKEPLAGEVAFKLYDTYGFPLDLTQVILAPRTVDLEGFNQAMKQQKELARASWQGASEKDQLEKVAFDLLNEKGATEFLGYQCLQGEGLLYALVQEEKLQQKVVFSALDEPSESFSLITSQTPCYGEAGGQEGDQGIFETPTGEGVVLDTFKRADGKILVHQCQLQSGFVELDQTVHFSVNQERRQALKVHHSATHLLHKALQHFLGDKVVQKGSLVAQDRLRFDFSYPKSLEQEVLQKISDEVNLRIVQNTPVLTQLMSPEKARDSGATALFGEKYGEEVRVVQMGSQQEDEPYSLELCGGTHVSSTGEIGLFHILSEGSVGSGVRRIEAVAGRALLDHLHKLERLVNQSALLLKVTEKDMPGRISKLLDDRRDLEKKLQNALKKGSSNMGEEKIGHVSFITQLMKDVPPGELRGVADQLRQKSENTVIVVGTCFQEKGGLVVALTSDLTNSYNAIELARSGAFVLGGKGGGGRPDMAQAGGPHGSRLTQAVQEIRKMLAKS